MLRMDLRQMRLRLLAGAFFVGAMTAFVPVSTAIAQAPGSVRGLPDFTDLVDQVGPSVVNIRTVEKASSQSEIGPSASA